MDFQAKMTSASMPRYCGAENGVYRCRKQAPFSKNISDVCSRAGCRFTSADGCFHESAGRMVNGCFLSINLSELVLHLHTINTFAVVYK